LLGGRVQACNCAGLHVAEQTFAIGGFWPVADVRHRQQFGG